MALPGKNSDLYRRLRFYAFGFLLGMLAVSVLYKGKTCQMPGSAKLEELSWQKLEYSEYAECIMKCRDITEAEIKQVFKSGKVNYDESDVHEKPYGRYAVEGITATNKSLRITITDCDTISKVVDAIDLKAGSTICECSESKQVK